MHMKITLQVLLVVFPGTQVFCGHFSKPKSRIGTMGSVLFEKHGSAISLYKPDSYAPSP